MPPLPSKVAAAARELGQCDLADLQTLVNPHILDVLPSAPGQRHRLLWPARTFILFLGQILAGNVSCSQTVSKLLAWLRMECVADEISSNTSAYCKARQRLPMPVIQQAHKHIIKDLQDQETDAMLWNARRVRVLDGSSVTLADTPSNQKKYPQPSEQKPGCGFPTVRLVALFSLVTGAWQHLAFGSLHVSETTLFRELWPQLDPGDVILADRMFCSFGTYWMLAQQGVDCVMRLIVHRSTGQRRVRRLGKGDCLMAWKRTSHAPRWIEPAVWRAMPKELVVRQININVDVPGFRTKTIFVVTTLLDPKMFPARSFADLYRRRWQIELYFRDLKTSLHMENLKCQSPQMISKELWIYVIAHNLIRLIIAQAAAAKGMEPRRISFKRTADALKEWLPLIYAHAGDIEWRQRMKLLLLRHIATLVVPCRPNRSEPRAKKRRPKPYALLTCHRSIYQETAHRNRYKPAKA